MAYPRIRQLGASGVAFQPPIVMTATPGASPSGAGVLSQSQVFGTRPSGSDGTRQDHIYSYYRAAMTSPGSTASVKSVVTLWAIANAQVDPSQPSEGKQNNPAATRTDASKALQVLASQGWSNANSNHPSYTIKTITTARPTPPTPVPVQPVKAPTVTASTPRSPSTQVVTTTPVATTLQPGQATDMPVSYVNYLPDNFPGSDMLTNGMMTQSEMQGGTGAAAPAATTAAALASDGGGAAPAAAPASGGIPGWVWFVGGFVVVGVALDVLFG